MIRQAGMYKHLVVIQKLTQAAKDADGFEGEATWEDYYSNRAKVNKLSGNEFWAAAEYQAQSTVKFEFRYHSALDALITDADATRHYRLVFKGKYWNITNVDDVMFKHETVKISAMEVD